MGIDGSVPACRSTPNCLHAPEDKAGFQLDNQDIQV